MIVVVNSDPATVLFSTLAAGDAFVIAGVGFVKTDDNFAFRPSDGAVDELITGAQPVEPRPNAVLDFSA